MFTKRVIWSVLLLLGLAGGIASAQESGRIEGRVTRSDGSGIGGVSVRVDETDQVVLTESDGGFVLEVAPGTYSLTFSLVDRTASQVGVEVAPGAAVTVDKNVDWDVSYAETITVTSASRRAERITEAPAAVTVVTEQEIEREAASGQLPKLLEFTPGVDFTPERPLRHQLQHPRLQQLAQPPHPDPDRRPRPGGAVPRRPGVGGGLLPARRAGRASSWCAAPARRSTAPTPSTACST